MHDSVFNRRCLQLAAFIVHLQIPLDGAGKVPVKLPYFAATLILDPETHPLLTHTIVLCCNCINVG